jgi:hypothetical protein
MTGAYTLLDRLALEKLGEETSHEGITGTVGVHKKLLEEIWD